MFEFLVELFIEEKRRCQENPSAYMLECESFHKNLGEIHDSLALADRANYFMAFIIKSIAGGPAREISAKNKLIVSGEPISARYAWTSAMLLGSVLPNKFNHNSIENYSKGFDEKPEMGFFSRFSSASLYETNFKKYLNEGVIKNFLVNSTQFESEKRANPKAYKPWPWKNELYKLDSALLAKFFRDIPITVNDLDLYNQELYHLGAIKLAEALKAIPTHITTLRLRYNKLNYLSGADLALIFGAIPSSITCFDVSGNDLKEIGGNQKSREDADLALAFSGFREGIATLMLADNKLSSYCSANIFGNIPKSVIQIFLKNNNFDNYVEELKREGYYDNKFSDYLTLRGPEEDKLVETFKHVAEHVVSPDTDVLIRVRKRILEVQSEKKRAVMSKNMALHTLVSGSNATAAMIDQHLSQGVDINFQDELTGYTVLMRAVDSSNERIAEYLLKNGANPSLKNKNGKTAADLASSSSAIYRLLKKPESLFSSPESTVASSSSLPLKKFVDLPVFSTISYKNIEFIGKKLGEGGFGIVSQAIWQFIEVAVKELKLARLSETAVNEFREEAELQGSLRHPNIVMLYGVCLEPGHYSMVMELMAKGSLYEVLHNSQDLPWSIRLSIAKDITIGLAYLHSKNIVHRDLKSLNVLLDGSGRAKLSDFGLSTIKSETSSTSTAGSAVGTVCWMAPELFKRGGKCTPASDIYAMGIVFWELSSRKLPFADATNQAIVMQWIKEGEREEIPVETPKKFAALIAQCWKERTEERPGADQILVTLTANNDETDTPAKTGYQVFSQ